MSLCWAPLTWAVAVSISISGFRSQHMHQHVGHSALQECKDSYPEWSMGTAAQLEELFSVLDRDDVIACAVDHQDRALYLVDFSDVAERIKRGVLYIVGDTNTRGKGALQDDPTHLSARGKLDRRARADRAPIQNHVRRQEVLLLHQV